METSVKREEALHVLREASVEPEETLAQAYGDIR
jgi:hypothetical protein